MGSRVRASLAAILWAVLLGSASAAEPGPALLGDFRLTSHEGRAFRFAELRGAPVLVVFGFTHCPDVCPLTLRKLAAVLGSDDPAASDLRVALISVDGDRDTPAVLRDYLQDLGPGFVGLTGPPSTVAPIAARFEAVFFKGLPEDKAGNYLVQHSSRVYLVDRDGRLAATLPTASAPAILAALRALPGPPAARSARR